MTDYDEVPNTSRSTMNELTGISNALRLIMLRENDPESTLVVDVDHEELQAGMTIDDLKQKIKYLDTAH